MGNGNTNWLLDFINQQPAGPANYQVPHLPLGQSSPAIKRPENERQVQEQARQTSERYNTLAFQKKQVAEQKAKREADVNAELDKTIDATYGGGLNEGQRENLRNVLRSQYQKAYEADIQQKVNAIPDARFRQLADIPGLQARANYYKHTPSSKVFDLRSPAAARALSTVMPILTPALSKEGAFQGDIETHDFFDEKGNPSPEFKRQVYEYANGNPENFGKAAKAIVTGRIYEYENAPSAFADFMQTVNQKLHDSGPVGKAGSYILQTAGSAAKGLAQIGAAGANMLEYTLGPDSVWDKPFGEKLSEKNAIINKNLGNVTPQGTEHWADKLFSELSQATGQYILAGQAELPGLGMLGNSAAFSSGTKGLANAIGSGERAALIGPTGEMVANSTMNKIAAAGYNALQGMSGSRAIRFLDNTLGFFKGAGAQVYGGYYDQLRQQGYSAQEASDKAWKRTFINAIAMGGLRNFISPANPQTNKLVQRALGLTENKLNNALARYGSAALTNAAFGAAEGTSASLADSWQNFQDAKERGELPQEASFPWAQALDDAKHAASVNGLLGAIMGTVNQHGVAPRDPQAMAIATAMNDPQMFKQLLYKSAAKGEITPEQVRTGEAFMDYLKPFYEEALKMEVPYRRLPGIQRTLFGKQYMSPDIAAKYAVEGARLKEAEYQLQQIEKESQQSYTITDENGRKTERPVALDERGIYTDEAFAKLQLKKFELQRKVEDAAKTMIQLQKGTYVKDRTISGPEMKTIIEDNTPGSVRQAKQIGDNGPYKAQNVELKQFEIDPDIQRYVIMMRNPVETKTHVDELEALRAERDEIRDKYTGKKDETTGLEIKRPEEMSEEDVKRVNEINKSITELNEKYPLFKDADKIVNFIPQNEVPPVLDAEGKVIDGRKRIAYAIASGQKTMEMVNPLTNKETDVSIAESLDDAVGDTNPNETGLDESILKYMQAAIKRFNQYKNPAKGFAAVAADMINTGLKKKTAVELLRRLTNDNISVAQAEQYYNSIKNGTRQIAAPAEEMPVTEEKTGAQMLDELINEPQNTEQDAAKVESPGTLDVGEQAGNGETMGEGNAGSEESTGAPQSTGTEVQASEAPVNDGVVRNDKGEIEKVLAPNGKESKLFEEINKGIPDKEEALKEWEIIHSDSFKEKFGDWEDIAQKLEEVRAELPNVQSFTAPVWMAADNVTLEKYLFELAQQYNASKSEREVAISSVTPRIMEIAHEMFPKAKSGDTFTPMHPVDENGEPKLDQVYDIQKETPKTVDGVLEKYKDRITRDKNGRVTAVMAPNGKLSKIWSGVLGDLMANNKNKLSSKEIEKKALDAWAYVYTDNFKKWFGDWEYKPEEASKMLDKNGEPIVFSHVSRANFEKFDLSKGEGVDKERTTLSHHGFFFSAGKRAYHLPDQVIYRVFLNVRNPEHINIPVEGEHSERLAMEAEDKIYSEWKDNIKTGINKEGQPFDGFILEYKHQKAGISKKSDYTNSEYVVFKPNQIKSIENTGHFDPASDNMFDRAEPTPSRVFFEHAGMERSGTVVSEEGDKVKVKGDNGRTYTVDKSEVRNEPTPTVDRLKTDLITATQAESDDFARSVAPQIRDALTNGIITDQQAKELIQLATEATKNKTRQSDFINNMQDILSGKSDEVAQTQKAYEEIAGMRPNGGTRIPVSPILNESPKAISDIINDVSKGLKQRLFFVKPGVRKAIGTYSPGSAGIKIRNVGDIDATAHEIGHALDDAYRLTENAGSLMNAELIRFSLHGSKPPAGHSDPLKYTYGEGLAEWLRAYIVNPEAAKIFGPELYKKYQELVPEQQRNVIDQFSRDARVYAGATGRDQTLANIQWEPKKEGVLNKMFARSDPNNMFSMTWADRLAAHFINPLRAFDKANKYARGIKGIDEILPEDDPVLLARTLLGVGAKTNDILEHGMVDAQLTRLKDKDGNTKNLNWLLEPFDNTDPASIEKDMKDAVAYMVAERTVELGNRFGRDDIITGIGAGLFRDVDVAKKTLDEIKSGDPNRLKRIETAVDRYRELSDDVLKYMVDKGRLSPEDYQQIKADNTQYVALQRVLETEPGKEIEVYKGKGGKLGSKKNLLERITGSTKQIQNPYLSLLDTVDKGIREADRNEVLRTFRDLLVGDRGMHEGQPERLSDIGIQVQQGEKESIPIVIDGKVEHWKFQKDVYKALKGLDADIYKLPAIATILPRILRWSVTHFPIFAARNVVRDLQDRIIKSNENDASNLFGIQDLVGNKEHWHDVALAGGLNSGMYMKDRTHYYGLMREAIHDMQAKGKSIVVDPALFRKAWHGYENLLGKSETVNRVAEYRAAYRKAKAKGMDDYNAKLYAGSRSRDLLDFAMMGHQMKWINQLIPFSNAAVQGLRSTAVRAKENPRAFALRIALFSVLPAVVEWALNRKDKDEYEDLPDYQRDMFHNFKIGPNKWVSIPKPYELSLAGAATSRGLSYIDGNDKAYDGYLGSVYKSLVPLDEGSIAGGYRPIIENMTNYDFFRNKSIVPKHEEPLDLVLRNTENASRLAKALQETSGIDARKWDHFINSEFSYFGNLATKGSNIGSETGEHFGIPDLGFFKNTPAYNSKSVRQFINYAEKWDLTKSNEYKEFAALAREYFDAPDDQTKDEAAKALREYAESTLSELESLREASIEKHNFDKEKR